MDRPGSRLAFILTMMILGSAITLDALPVARAQALESVTVQLKWHHQTQFAGNYVAHAKGLYAKAGLAVESRPWKVGSPSPIDQVLSGAATFGITSQTEFLVNRAKGAPVVAIAAIYQKSPVGFFALTTSGIRTPRDLVGKTIAYAPTHEIHLKAMLKRLGVDMARLRPVPYSFDLAPFYRGEVAVWAGYVMNQPVDARLAGHEVSTIFPDDYGVHMYDDIVFTAETHVQQKSGLVERWLRATLQGWRYAIEHPDEATEITRRIDPTRRQNKEMAMLLASIPLIHTGEHPIGWMTRETWTEASNILVEQKILGQSPELDKAYTTAFLSRIYQK